MALSDRFTFFLDRKEQNRFWWFQQNDFLPQIYAELSNEEWSCLRKWFLETEKRNMVGECNIPAMSVMLGFVHGSGIERIVQLGHYAGYSTLLFGWALKRMGKERGLISFDINQHASDFAQEWIERADLTDQVRLVIADSTDVASPHMAMSYFNNDIVPTVLGKHNETPSIPLNDPQMVFIDSSHQYEQTLKELEMWYWNLQYGGFIFLHDVSLKAVEYDTTGEGGVHNAFEEWQRGKAFMGLGMMSITDRYKVYKDGCGLGIIQK